MNRAAWCGYGPLGRKEWTQLSDFTFTFMFMYQLTYEQNTTNINIKNIIPIINTGDPEEIKWKVELKLSRNTIDYSIVSCYVLELLLETEVIEMKDMKAFTESVHRLVREEDKNIKNYYGVDG